MPISLSDKLQKEYLCESDDSIRLYHEGLFYSCYECSAIKLKRLLPQLQLLQQRRKDGKKQQGFKLVIYNKNKQKNKRKKVEQSTFFCAFTPPQTMPKSVSNVESIHNSV